MAAAALALSTGAEPAGASPAPPASSPPSPAPPSLAPPSPPVARRGALDPRIDMMFARRARTGGAPRFVRPSPRFAARGELPLAVHFARPPSADEWRRYEALGARAGVEYLSGARQVVVTEEAYRAMRADGVLARASIDLAPPRHARPLQEARAVTGVRGGVEAYRRRHGAALTGAGVTVGDIDGTADVYHPAFFRAGAPVAWVDVDGDGRLSPDVDGVDVDGDGAVGPGEVLRQLNGEATPLFFGNGPIAGTGDGRYDPAWDYLYLDEDGDGRRDTGGPGASARGALGEPAYVADDVDGDGAVTAPERLRPLGASKFRAVRYVEADAGGGEAARVLRRGENLGEFAPALDPADGPEHATSALGIVAGGQSGASRFLGLAPDVDLLLAAFGSEAESYDAKLTWLVDEGAQVVLTELGYWGFAPADGSDEFEQSLDRAVERGVLVVSPAGNLGDSTKHAFATVPSASAPVPYANALRSDGDEPRTIYLSVTWREGDQAIDGELDFGDERAALGEDGEQELPSGRTVSVGARETVKGAGFLSVTVDLTRGGMPGAGSIGLRLRSKGDKPLTSSLYVIDDVSSWAGGVNFEEGTARGCMNSPAFAANVLAVGAFSLHAGGEFGGDPASAGALRSFSGRGPDLWGDPGIDLAAPDNAVAAATNRYEVGSTHGLSRGVAWQEFGGTSGAAPVVAALAALRLQADPNTTGLALRRRLLDAAARDAFVDAGTADEWGAGKAHFDGPSAPGSPPSVALEFEGAAVAGAPLTVRARVTDPDDAAGARARWDVGYDGAWDGDLADALATTVVVPPAGSHVDVKVEVQDADGWVAAAVARIDTTVASGAGAPGAAGGAPAPPAGGAPGAAPSPATPARDRDDGCGACAVGRRGNAPGAPFAAGLAAGALAALAARRRRRAPAR